MPPVEGADNAAGAQTVDAFILIFAVRSREFV
jgi:hypothetical protein